MNAQEKLIRRYVAKNFPDVVLNESSRVSIERETRSGGYCETCWYEYEEWVIMVDGKIVETFDDDLASLLNRMLEGSE